MSCVGRRLRFAFCAALPLAGARIGAADAPTRPVWASLQAMETLGREACQAVERASGARFEEKPGVRIASPAKTGGRLAAYVPDPVAILVAPELIDTEVQRLGAPAVDAASVARAAITREVARSLDIQRRALSSLRDRLPDMPQHRLDGEIMRSQRELLRAPPNDVDPDEVTDALWDGHALLLAEDAATERGLAPVVERWNRVEGKTRARRARDFLRALRSVGGRLAIDEALFDPPASLVGLDHAEAYSARNDSVVALDRVLEPFRTTAPAEAYVRSDFVRRGGLRHVTAGMRGIVPREAFDGYRGGRCLVAGDGAAKWAVAAAVLRWDSPDAARSFLRSERAGFTRADAAKASWPYPEPMPPSTYEEAAGPGRRFPGFVARWEAGKWGSGPSRLLTHVFAIESLVIEVALLDPDEAALARIEPALEEAVRAVSAVGGARLPAELRPAPEPTWISPGRGMYPWPAELDLPRLCALGVRAGQDLRLVQIRVVDWRGSPVSHAGVGMREGDIAGMYLVWPTWNGRFVWTGADGRAAFWIRGGWVNHEAWSWPPEDREDVGDADAHTWWRPEDCTLTLPRTFVVRGVVRDARGRPTRARVECRGENGAGGTWNYSEPDGRFEFRMPYGPVDLAARPAEPYVRDWSETWDGHATPEHPTADLVVQKPKPDPPPK